LKARRQEQVAAEPAATGELAGMRIPTLGAVPLKATPITAIAAQFDLCQQEQAIQQA
jgi:hypothetical protein